MTFKGHSRSLEISRFGGLLMISYYCSIVIYGFIVSTTYSQILVENREIYIHPPIFNIRIGEFSRNFAQRCLVFEKL